MLALLTAALADRYAIERELGRGGMASVWLARDRRHDRPVAIKVLHPELAGVIGVDRFVREIRLTAHLQHANIVPVFDSGTFTGANGVELPWYAMAYVEGESLRARLERERQLPIDEALAITGEAYLADESIDADGPGELGVQDLDGDGAIVPEVSCEPDRRHAAAPELSLDGVAAGQGGLEEGEHLRGEIPWG